MCEENNEALNNDDTSQQVSDNGISAVSNARHNIQCLTIIGQVEGHYILPSQNKTTKYEHIIPALVAVEEDTSVEGLLIVLNTVGGDVEAGLAIAELIAGLSKPTVSIVVGGGHSIGVPLAVSAQESFIVPSATMTIHPVRTNGMVLGVPQTMCWFERMQERITHFVTTNSRMKPERFHQLLMEKDELVMDIGTVLDGDAAVNEGLIDHLGGLSDAVERLYKLIEERSTSTPKPQRKRASKKAEPLKPTTKKRGRPKGTAATAVIKASTVQSRADQLNSRDWHGER